MDKAIAKKILEETKEDYERIAEGFSSSRSYIWPEMEVLSQYVKDGDNILDVGCGNGRFYELFRNQSVIYTGVDSSSSLIKIAQRNYKLDKEKFIVADALNLPFRDQYFDKVFMIAFLHQIPSRKFRQRVLKEARRVLKSDGLLLLTNWDLWRPKKWPLLFKYTFLKLFKQTGLDLKDVIIKWNGKGGIGYYHLFTLRELKKLLEKISFKVLENYYSRKRKKVHWWQGRNIVTIAQKMVK